jgi:NitT/TauT family transport system substrate-binding protein
MYRSEFIRIFLHITIVFILFVIAGCNSQTTLPKLDGKITIGAYTGEVAALVWIAKEKGFFDAFGLDIEIKEFSAGKLASDALTTGDVDIITCTEFVFVKKSFDDPDLRIMGTISTYQIMWIVGRKDHNIISQDDLKGKTIGVTMGSSGEYYLGQFLLANKMNFNDITIVDLTPSKLVESIIKGKIDAAITWQPNVKTIQKILGNNIVSFEAQRGQNSYFILLSNKNWIASHPQHTARLMQSLALSENWVNMHPEETKESLSKLFLLDQEYMNHIWEVMNIRLSFPQALVVAMDGEKRWLVNKGSVKTLELPDYTDFLYVDAIETVKKHDVTVIK